MFDGYLCVWNDYYLFYLCLYRDIICMIKDGFLNIEFIEEDMLMLLFNVLKLVL